MIDTDQLRFKVKLDIEVAVDYDFDEDDGDRDHLLEIEHIIEDAEAVDEDLPIDNTFQRRAFDLCQNCFNEFKKDPLNCDSKVQVDFSKN